MRETSPTSAGHLRGQIAIVLGAASGVGQGIAIELAREGATVVLCDHPQINHEETAHQIELLSGNSWICGMDVSQEQDQRKMVEAVLERYQRIDLVVHNAGMRLTTHRGIAGISRESGEEIFRANLIEPFLFTQLVVEAMHQRHLAGAIIFLFSTPNDVTALDFDPISNSTSTALSMLVRDLALDLAAFSIRVNAVAFSALTTQNHPNPFPDKLVPLGYRITIEDIAAGVAFLASPKARFITGTTLTIDGGLSLVSGPYLRSKGMLSRRFVRNVDRRHRAHRAPASHRKRQ